MSKMHTFEIREHDKFYFEYRRSGGRWETIWWELGQKTGAGTFRVSLAPFAGSERIIFRLDHLLVTFMFGRSHFGICQSKALKVFHLPKETKKFTLYYKKVKP